MKLCLQVLQSRSFQHRLHPPTRPHPHPLSGYYDNTRNVRWAKDEAASRAKACGGKAKPLKVSRPVSGASDTGMRVSLPKCLLGVFLVWVGLPSPYFAGCLGQACFYQTLSNKGTSGLDQCHRLLPDLSNAVPRPIFFSLQFIERASKMASAKGIWQQGLIHLILYSPRSQVVQEVDRAMVKGVPNCSNLAPKESSHSSRRLSPGTMIIPGPSGDPAVRGADLVKNYISFISWSHLGDYSLFSCCPTELWRGRNVRATWPRRSSRTGTIS